MRYRMRLMAVSYGCFKAESDLPLGSLHDEGDTAIAHNINVGSSEVDLSDWSPSPVEGLVRSSMMGLDEILGPQVTGSFSPGPALML